MLAIVVAVSVLLLDTPYAALVFGVFWLIGAGEWARLAGLGRAGRVVFAGLFATIVTLVLGFGLPDGLAEAILALAVACWAVIFVCVLRYPRPIPLGPIPVAGLVVLTGAWLAFYVLHGIGAGIVLAGLVIVWSADIGAFFVGRSLGRTALAPRVSPKKTWEGVAGGVAMAAVAGAIAAGWLGLPIGLLTPLAAVTALVSVVGDLGVSLLKRRAGRKDSGVLLPGHGGVLDRFDGVTAALPFFALGLQFTHVLD